MIDLLSALVQDFLRSRRAPTSIGLGATFTMQSTLSLATRPATQFTALSSDSAGCFSIALLIDDIARLLPETTDIWQPQVTGMDAAKIVAAARLMAGFSESALPEDLYNP